MTTARELYDVYTAAAKTANVPAKAFKSFNNKGLIQDAIDALPKPAPATTSKLSGKKAQLVHSLTKVERARLRRWNARHGIGHTHGQRYITENLAVEALIAIGHIAA